MVDRFEDDKERMYKHKRKRRRKRSGKIYKTKYTSGRTFSVYFTCNLVLEKRKVRFAPE